MKKLIHSLLLIASASSLIVACKKESIAPNQNDISEVPSSSANHRGESGLIANQETYKLSKRGADSLIYRRDGRLGKVMQDPANYTEYTYGTNSITSKRYMNNSLWVEVYYKLDPGTGRAIESTRKQYLALGSMMNITYSGEVYVYDASGRLTSKYNMSKPKERYVYTQGGDNFSIDVYAADGSYKYLHYHGLGNKVPNKLKLNPEKSGLDMYLNIFGTVSKYVLASQHTWDAAIDGWSAGEKHTYTFNNANYPTQLVRTDLLNGAAPITEKFGYHVTK